MKKNKFLLFTLFSLALCIISACLTGTQSEAKQLTSINDAKKAAKKHVSSAQVTSVEMDTEKGATVYEVELIKKNKEYNLKFRASDGKLLEYEWELPNTSYSIQNKANIAKKTIKKKALKLIKKGTVSSVRLTIDDGLAEYKVAVKKGNRQYKLLYNAKNGKLLEYEWKLVSSSSSSSGKNISSQEAQNIALKKVPGATVIKVEYDKDDGVAVYEIELKKDGFEYDIKIDAKSGKILEFEKEIDD